MRCRVSEGEHDEVGVVTLPSVFESLREIITSNAAGKSLLKSLRGGELLTNLECSDIWEQLEALLPLKDKAEDVLEMFQNVTKLGDAAISHISEIVEAKLYFENGCGSVNVTDSVGEAFSGTYMRSSRSVARATRVSLNETFGDCDPCQDPRCDVMFLQEDCGAEIYANGTCHTVYVNDTSPHWGGWCLFHEQADLLACSEDKVAQWPWNVTRFSSFEADIMWNNNC
eukprot:GHVS01020314.1.p1 GENE.GHVS01020314.1~~GHVS01020314.1.p1  ORF type:complete len:227 (+),score=26.10 GHVS01020314.1:419-1099(+)